MKIYQNKWSGLKRYFIKIFEVSVGRRRLGKGISIILYPDNKWRISWEYCDPYDLKNDSEHFPVVGNINLKKLLIEAILNAVGERDGGKE